LQKLIVKLQYSENDELSYRQFSHEILHTPVSYNCVVHMNQIVLPCLSPIVQAINGPTFPG